MRRTRILELTLSSLALGLTSSGIAGYGAAASAAPPGADYTITVTTQQSETVKNGKCSLNEAIDNLNLGWAVTYNNLPNPHPDCPAGAEYFKIVLPAGKYTLGLTDECRQDFTSAPTPSPCLQSTRTTSGRWEIHVKAFIEGMGPGATFLEGELIRITQLADVLINGVTFQNSPTSAILNQAHLELDNVHIQDNSLDLFTGAGGVRNEGQLRVINSVIRRNQGNGGGGISNDGNLWLTNTIVSENRSITGGGLLNQGGSATIEGVTLNQNGATVLGSQSETSLTGGGIFNGTDGLLSMRNVTLSSNVAIKAGGGVYSQGNALLTNVTITNNGAGRGGGVHVESGQFEIWNVLLGPNLGSNCSGQPLWAQRGNLSSDGSCAGGVDYVNLDPKLGPLADNGGLTWTHAPQFGSPAVDHGTLDKCSGSDQRGEPRPEDGDSDGKAECDIGAVELKGGSFVIITPELQPVPVGP
jgi:hypothetical protein